MQTIAFYDMLKSVFEDRIRKIDADTKELYRASVEDVKKDVSEIAKEFRHVDPIMAPYLLPAFGEIDETEIPMLIERAKVRAKNRHGLGLIYTGTSSTMVIQRTAIHYPKFIDTTSKPHVLIKPYTDKTWEDFAVRMMNQIVLGCLMCMPKGFVTSHLSFRADYLQTFMVSL